MNFRQDYINQLESASFDALIVGGGINGAVSAAALSAQGLRIALIDQGDFAGVASQESSNLAWGGIKYLENGELGLVRNLCRSRNRLLTAYPSAVREIRFLTTLDHGFRRRRTTLYAGAWLYWLIGGGFTRIPRLLSADAIESEEPAVNAHIGPGGIEFSDSYLVDNDARFVFGFVRDAVDRGAVAANYVQSLGSRRAPDGGWCTRAIDVMSGRVLTIRSRITVNACGANVDAVNNLVGIGTRHRHVFSKGVHLIVDRIAKCERILAFFADDGRLFFVIPMGSKSCIGTTDTRVDEIRPAVTSDERRFILDNINKRLRLSKPLSEADIIAERCGVRPLAVERSSDVAREADWTSLSRKHVLEVDAAGNYISIFGGKITDCLNIGDEVVATAQSLGAVSRDTPTPWYGEPDKTHKLAYLSRVLKLQIDRYTFGSATEHISERLWRRYGSDAVSLLERIRKDPTMADILIPGTDYLRCELYHAAEREMIVQLEDLLRRRSNIAMLVRHDELKRAPGVAEACRILFGGDAQSKFDEYFAHAQSAEKALSRSAS